MLTKDQISANKTRFKPEDFCIVYFLFSGDEIVYVGKSENGIARILQHVSEGQKLFTHYSYIVVEKDSLESEERAYIKSYRPKYNIAMNPQYRIKRPDYYIDEDGKKHIRKKFNHRQLMAREKRRVQGKTRSPWAMA
jgi:predicted GIY-YIG superfamily endonuclease